MTRGRWFLLATGLLLFVGWYVSVGVGYDGFSRPASTAATPSTKRATSGAA